METLRRITTTACLAVVLLLTSCTSQLWHWADTGTIHTSCRHSGRTAERPWRYGAAIALSPFAVAFDVAVVVARAAPGALVGLCRHGHHH